MKYIKHAIALLLCLLLVFQIGGPALPRLSTGGVTAEAAGDKKWLNGDDFDVENSLRVLGNISKRTSDNAIKWTEVGNPDKTAKHTYDLENWYYQEENYKYFTSPDYTYIRLVGDIGEWYSDKWHCVREMNDIIGKETWADAYVISSSKVIDLNGHKMEFMAQGWSGKSDVADFTQFYITGKDTTVIFMDSSADQTGCIRFIGDVWSTSKHYTDYQMRNLFEITGGASVYVLGGSFQAGSAEKQNVASYWDKVKRIGGAILKAVLGLASAGASVCATIATGGLAGSSISQSLGNVASMLDSGAGAVQGMTTAIGMTTATNPVTQNPQNKADQIPGDAKDADGKNSGATSDPDGHNGGSDGKAGGASSVVMDLAGVYEVTNRMGAFLYCTNNNSADNQKLLYTIGDQVAVIGEQGDNWYKVIYDAGEGYMLKTDLEKADGHVWDDEDVKLIRDRGSAVVTLRQSMLNKLHEATKPKPSDSDELKEAAKYMDVIRKGINDQEVQDAVESVAELIGTCCAPDKRFWHVAWGTCFTVTGNSKLVIFDGNFLGYGQDKESRKGHRARNEVIECIDGETYVFGGKFYGMAGADIFYLNKDRAKLTIRGGTFDCSSVNVFRGMYDENLSKDNEDGKRTENIVGTRGSINAPVECYGEDLIADGRIQLNEAAGAGNLVLKNTDPYDSNRIVYSLYCDKSTIPGLAHLLVEPAESEHMMHSFKLIGKADQDGVLDGQGYIDYICGVTDAYVAPRFFGNEAAKVIASAENADSIADAVDELGGFYYSFPKTKLLNELRTEYVKGSRKTGYENLIAKCLRNVRCYTYEVFEVDPMTQANLTEKPIASKTVSDQDILTGQVYLVPNADNTQTYLMEAEQWQPGHMYRVKLTVTEYFGIGRLQYVNDSHIKKTSSSTSLIVRCRETDGVKFTPLHFKNLKTYTAVNEITKKDETHWYLNVGDTATAQVINARAGFIDIYGEKIFSMTYDWRVEGYDDVHLVTTTRTLHQGEGKAFTINGRVYDEDALTYGQTVTTPQGYEIEEREQVDLGDEPGEGVNIPISTKPYYSSEDKLQLPETFVSGGKTIPLEGKRIYCEVTYGICYGRWSRAFKYLPIMNYHDSAAKLYSAPANKNKTNLVLSDSDVITVDANDGGTRDTMANKTFRTKSIEVLPKGAEEPAKPIKNIVIDYKLPVHGKYNAVPTTKTEGVGSITYTFRTRAGQIIGSAEYDDTIVIRFEAEADPGYVFASDWTASLADGTTLTPIMSLSDEHIIACRLTYTVPAPEGGVPYETLGYGVTPPVAGKAPQPVVAMKLSEDLTGRLGAETRKPIPMPEIIEQEWTPADETFKAGEAYSVTFTIQAGEKYTFNEGTNVLMVAQVGRLIKLIGEAEIVATDGKTATVKYTFDRLPEETHAIKVESGYVVGEEKAAEGKGVKIIAEKAPEGKVFDKWVIVSGEGSFDDETADETEFTMCNTDVELKATYKDAPPVEHEHVWDAGTVTKAATCTEPGVMTYKCSDCDETKTEDIPATGHKDENKDGKCDVCGIAVDHEHVWDAGTITKAAACTEKGEKTYKCTLCGETRREDIPATGHKDENKDGKCDVCGEKTGEVTPPAPSALRGDADLDGKVLAKDARLALRVSAKLETLEPQGFTNCDLDGNNKITAKEARLILRYSAKLEKEI